MSFTICPCLALNQPPPPHLSSAQGSGLSQILMNHTAPLPTSWSPEVLNTPVAWFPYISPFSLSPFSPSHLPFFPLAMPPPAHHQLLTLLLLPPTPFSPGLSRAGIHPESHHFLYIWYNQDRKELRTFLSHDSKVAPGALWADWLANWLVGWLGDWLALKK